jgi:hypothetical protein
MNWGLAATVAWLACLAILYWRHRAREQGKRAQFFAGCLDLFQTYRVVQDDIAYPVLTGTYRGHDVRLEPVVDHMAWRKLPVLWLKVSVLKPNPYAGVLDFLMRPLGTEFYSPSGHLDHQLKLPEAWPQDALLCTDDPSTMPPMELMTPHMQLFANTKMKELVVTPMGVRLVCQIWQASRTHYVTLREIRFDGELLDRELLRERLDAAIAIADSVSEPARLIKVA